MSPDALYPMLSVEEALERLLAHFVALEPESAPVHEALDRVLAQDVHATDDIPPHANSAMDGYALRAAETGGASPQTPLRLRVIADLAAGYVAKRSVEPGTAIRIMTGAPLPAGADAVVQFERTEQQGEWVAIMDQATPGLNVRLAGEDVQRGTLVLRRGSRLRPQEIGMLAALGCGTINVTRRPRVAILATGDELVDIDAPLTPGKIRNANGYTNAAQVTRYGGIPLMLGIARDDATLLTDSLREGLAQGADLLLTSGGVSVGDFDVVKQVLAAEGEVTFWRVRMKPGKPLAFGRIEMLVGGRRRSVPLIGLPGNPVSAMISCEIMVRPAILRLLGCTDLSARTLLAELAEPILRKDERRHYVRVRLEHVAAPKPGAPSLRAHPTGDQGAGILNSLVMAQGLAVIPEEWPSAQAGDLVQVLLLD
jgi:molybdopterin molybdotransferase